MEENFQTSSDNTQTNDSAAGLDNNAGNDNSAQQNENLFGNGGDNQENSFDIPDEYKDKEWAKSFEGKTGDELKNEIFKTIDEKYSKTPVIPEDVKGYALNEVEFKDEEGNTTYEYPPDVLEHFGQEFKDLGLTKEQAQGILTKYTNFELEQFAALTDINELNQNIDEMFKSNPAQKQQVQSLLKEFLPIESQQFLQQTAPNHTIIMFYQVAKGFLDKYGYKEGSGGQGQQNNYRMSKEDRDKEYDRIVGEMEALTKRPHTSEEKQNLQNQLNALFK